MTLQSSGAISLSQIQSEYGGSNPISMSEYYRNGSYVPNAITSSSTGPGSYTSYQYSRNVTDWRVFISGSISWGGSAIVSNTFSIGTSTTTYSTGGYDYQRGSQAEIVTSGSGKFTSTTVHYRIRRRQSSVTTTTSTSVNQSVPTSGQISLSNFYGGRKT